MPKDTSNDFFNEEKKPTTSNPDNMGKWINVAEKGISLLENIMKMRGMKLGNQNNSGGGETSAYEKGLAQGQQISQPKPISINYKTDEAVNYLMNSLKNLDENKTIKEYVDGDLKDMKESGILNAGMEQFLKTFVEVSR